MVQRVGTLLLVIFHIKDEQEPSREAAVFFFFLNIQLDFFFLDKLSHSELLDTFFFFCSLFA